MSSEKQIRMERRELLLQRGVELYPYYFKTNSSIREIKQNFNELEQSDEEVSLAGRVISLRGHGKTMFLDLMNDHEKIQLYFKSEQMDEDCFKLAKKIDIGDFIGVSGKVMKTKTGEVTLRVLKWMFLSKSLMSLPEKFHGLKDPEIRYRQRYLDFIANPSSTQKMIIRSKIIKEIRNFLDERGFIEIETPILQPIYGGAFAEPFSTHYNSLDREFFLRVSNELYLKRLLIGGFNQIYEFAKDFRNEGMDKDHNPEFTQVEVYQAYVDYYAMMELTEQMFRQLALKIHQSLQINYAGHILDFSQSWNRISFIDEINRVVGESVKGKTSNQLEKIAEKFNIDCPDDISGGKILDLLFSNLIQPDLIQPTFVMDHPLEISPLAKVHRHNPDLVERFEPIIGGMEVGNAFSELNDPVEQRRRLEYQNKLRLEGGKENQPLDEDFLQAMSYGMPPAGGLGLGVDRIVMIFTDSDNIKEVLAFPHLKTLPKQDEELMSDSNPDNNSPVSG
ncbi:MAG: hypothetical protein APR63_07470 [Desulfuromonas sp. SDB]|nr:MAG: hypothetical protein APR63_07470 [Desulfuromonas sp. SDB]